MRTLAVSLALLLFAGGALAQDNRFPLPPKDWPKPVMDEEPRAFLFLDRFEYRAQKGDDSLFWDPQAWFGGDYNKLWLKAEGERRGGRTEDAEFQVLYARRIAPFWHVQGGVRSEVRPTPAQNYGVIALQGLAPYWFGVEASAFLRGGEIAGRLEVEYDQLLTQRLVAQPRMEINSSSTADPERGVGRGINDVELGLRLRYEISREFAPYVGINWRRKAGDTADLARARGEDVGATSLVLGVRVWY